MTDKIVYVHPTLMSRSVNIITPRDLDVLLEQDWRIKDRKRQRVEGKMVDVVHLIQTHVDGDRAVAIARQRPHGMTAAPERSGAPVLHGSLAKSDFANLPGLELGSSMLISHAYSLGVDAAYAGAGEASCPWPKGSVPATEWLKGFRSGARARDLGDTSGSTDDAYALGKLAAKGDDDLEVHCPYPEETPQYQAWLRGFREHGGRVD